MWLINIMYVQIHLCNVLCINLIFYSDRNVIYLLYNPKIFYVKACFHSQKIIEHSITFYYIKKIFYKKR